MSELTDMLRERAAAALPPVDGELRLSGLQEPVEVFRDVARVVRPGGPFVCTFSNRCFPTKAVRGWLSSSDEQRARIVTEYFRRAGSWAEPVVECRAPAYRGRDPLFAVWAVRPPAS